MWYVFDLKCKERGGNLRWNMDFWLTIDWTFSYQVCLWNQSQVPIVWNTRETSNIYSSWVKTTLKVWFTPMETKGRRDYRMPSKWTISDDRYLLLEITVTKRQIVSKIYLTGRSQLRRVHVYLRSIRISLVSLRYEYCTQESSLSVICAVLVWLSNNSLKTGTLYEWNMSEIQTKISWNLKFASLNDQTALGYSKTGLVRYSDFYWK